MQRAASPEADRPRQFSLRRLFSFVQWAAVLYAAPGMTALLLLIVLCILPALFVLVCLLLVQFVCWWWLRMFLPQSDARD